MKVFFIGTGVITYAHADGLKLIGSEPSACYDIFKPSAERFAKTYGCEAVDDYKEYLDTERPDYVLVCTPPGVRLEYMEEVMSGRAQASAAETWLLPGEPTRSSCAA